MVGQERYVRDRRKSLNRVSAITIPNICVLLKILQSFFKDASAAFVVFDSCEPSTFNCVTEWKEIIDYMVRQKNGDPIPVFVLANKVTIL